MDDKVQKRREKLAEWKAKRSQQTKDSKDQPGAGLGASTTNTPTIAKTAKPAQKKYRFAIAQLAQRPLGDTRLALGESDNDEPAMNGKQFSDDKPTAGTFKQKQVDTEMEYKVASDDDPLDAFMDHVESQVRDLAAATLDLAQADAAKLNLLLNEDDQDEEIATEREDSPPPMANPYDDDFNASEKRNRLLETDHSKIDYEPFRKDFYVEPPDLAEMTPMQVNQRRLDLDGIKVRGVRCPKPIERWSQFGMPPGVHQVIKKVLKYDRPSSIQAQAIPAIMSGRDVIGIARTGSGKRPCRGMEGPIALIMTPTRELAVQIHKEIKFFTKVLNIRSICCYGGSPIGEQIADLKRGAEIVVCTPGRMIDLLCANGGRVTNLRRVTYLVLDEADRMFDMGFEPQVMKIMYNIRKDRQSLLFSATFPKTMEGLARKILWKPIEIIVGARSVVAKDVTQIVEIYPDEDSKFLRLLEILGRTASEDEYAKTLIFVDRQDAADAMLTNLMRRGYPCSSIHGGKDQSDRDQTILDFKLGNTSILIATSVAARGLDVKDLKNVVNFECPNHLEDYVHRCGRTGRAGHKGVAYTFLTPDQDKYAEDIVKALTQSGTPIPFDLRELVENYEAKVRAGQVVSSGSGYGGKGLAHLEFQREVLKIVQKKSHGHDDDQDDQEAMRDADNDAPIDEPGNMQMISMKFNSLKDKAQALVRERSLAQQVQHGRSSAEANFYAEVEINDYPQQARFKVTSKEYIQKICELSGSAITVRGAFVQAGQKPQFNEPKLHLYIEGDNQYAVDRAKMELRDCLREAQASTLDQVLKRY